VSLDFAILGPLAVTFDGEAIVIGSPRRKRLLAALLLHANRVRSVDQLIDDVWDDAPPENAAATLQAHVSYLRRALGQPVIVTRPPGYAIELDDDQLDSLRFERLVATGVSEGQAGAAGGAEATLRSAIDLWRGELLADLGDTPLVAAARPAWEERRGNALEAWAEAALSAGHPAAVVETLTAALLEHPHREDLVAHLMIALYRTGRQQAALDVFQTQRARLVDELGLDPSPQLRDLEARILRQDPTLATASPGRVAGGDPSPAGNLFVGRDREVARLRDLLTQPGLVTITGMGGSGKTRLADHLAKEMTERRPVYVVELAAVDRAGVVDAVAGATGARPQPGQSLTTAVSMQLVATDALLVLDNCEHLVEECAELSRSMIADAADLSILATSRVALGLADEVVLPLPPLEVPESGVDVGQLERIASVALFVDRARASRASFQLTEQNAEAVAELCRAVEGLPLALELAAARVGVADVKQLADRLRTSVDVLADAADGRTARHHTLRAALDWGHELLTDHDRVLFRRLAPFAGTFSLESAEAVAGTAPLAPADVLDGLERLVNASLLFTDDQASEVGLRLRAPVRQYAQELLADSGEETSVRGRHLDHVAEVLQGLLDRVPPDLPSAESHQPDLRAALGWSLASGERAVDALKLATTAQRLWLVRGLFAEGQRWLDALLDAAVTAPAALRVAALLATGSLHQLQGDLSGAEDRYDEALVLARHEGDAGAAARALLSKGNAAVMRGDLRADELLTEAATVARDTADDDLLMRALNGLGVVARRAADFGRARAVNEEGLQVARRLGDDVAVATMLLTLGNVRHAQGDPDEARDRFTEALAVTRRAGYVQGEAAVLGSLGSLATETGDLVTARTHLEASLDLARTIGDRLSMATTLANLGSVHRELGEVGAARTAFEEGRSVSQALGDRRGVAHAVQALAELALAAGRPDDALELAREALVTRQQLGDHDYVVASLETLGSIEVARSQHVLGARLLAAADARRSELGSVRNRADQAAWADAVSEVRRVLGPAFDGTWTEGRTLDLESAVRVATGT
jgi:predicted ATPase/DNA-binding SARP family transcriptional activator